MVYSSERVATEERSTCESSFPVWLRHHSAIARQPFEAAQIITVGDSAIMRVRSAGGEVKEKVIMGQNPTLISVAGTALEVLYVAARKRSVFEGAGYQSELDPVVFIRDSGTLTLDRSNEATVQIAQRFGAERAWVSIRNDRWFVCDQYPPFDPFAGDQPPSESEYERLPEFGCTVSYEKPHCVQLRGTK